MEDFLDSLPGKSAQRVAWVLRLIEETEFVPAQYFKKLPGTVDLWEVRVQSGNDTIRLLGFLSGSHTASAGGATASSVRLRIRTVKVRLT